MSGAAFKLKTMHTIMLNAESLKYETIYTTSVAKGGNIYAHTYILGGNENVIHVCIFYIP